MAIEKITRKCRRCGRVFTQQKTPSKYAGSTAGGAFVLHSFCESCRRANRRRARECDPRYAAIGGHGFVEIPTPGKLRMRRSRSLRASASPRETTPTPTSEGK